ncbi:MAG: heme-binding protein [Hyphomicrobiaceae bacterium]|nr:heme-binding protein [Hyphomicrobiaceae bacterium]
MPASISLDIAERIVDGAIAAASRLGTAPMAAAVLDAGGHLVAFKRQDGVAFLRCDIAQAKAWTALAMGTSSRGSRDRLAQRPTFQAALSALSQGRFIPVPGGVLILGADRCVVGAAGMSGDASDKDEACCIEAVRAVGLLSYPAEPAPGWEDAT